MDDIPAELRYTDEHEWVRAAAEDDAGGPVTIGITAFAQDQLGDVVYVELPKVGATLKAAQPFGVVESVKAASDLFAPIAGTVVEVNARLEDEPELVNTSPYGDGWMLRIAPADPAAVAALLDADAYRVLLDEQG